MFSEGSILTNTDRTLLEPKLTVCLLNTGDVVPVALDNFPHYRFDYLVGRALKFFRTPVYGPPLISDKCLTLSFDGPQ